MQKPEGKTKKYRFSILVRKMFLPKRKKKKVYKQQVI